MTSRIEVGDRVRLGVVQASRAVRPSFAVVQAESQRLALNEELNRLGELVNKNRLAYRRALADFRARLDLRGE